MCGGSREIQSRRPPRLAPEMKPNTPHVAADGALLITSCPRRQPAAAGLAIVAALEAELVQSGSATTANKAAESAPPSPTSPLPAMPIPIAASAQEEITEAGYTVKNHSRGAQRSIFSTSLSPPSTSFMMSCNLHNIREPNDDFLGVCFFCKRPLGPGKDIYMYRGDRAFCSTECRHKHIITDESLLCKVQINQQCVQASCPTNQSKFTPSITIPVLV